MSEKRRLVLDTNVLVSAVLLLSEQTRGELLEVLYRPRLQRYIVKSEREGVLGRVAIRAERVEVEERIEACRDPKDDTFLEAVVSGEADYLVSGDEDLLVLHPFRGLPILSPAAFLEEIEHGTYPLNSTGGASLARLAAGRGSGSGSTRPSPRRGAPPGAGPPARAPS